MRENLRTRPNGTGVRSALAPALLALLVVACGSSGSSSGDDHGDAAADAAAIDDGSSSMDATQTEMDATQPGMDATQTGMDATQTGMDATQTGMDAAGTGMDGASMEAGAEAGVEAGSNEAGSLDATADGGGVDAAEAGPPACSPTCADGHACGVAGDCASGVCTNGSCANAVCSPSCPDGHACGATGDCASGVCTNAICAAPACSPTCANAAACGATTDCASGVCTSGACAPPSCSPTCASGNVCGANTDCASGVCSGGTCRATYTFGGVLAGLTPGESIVLKDQSGNPLTLSANGPFTMTVPVLAGATYGVTVSTPPSAPIAQTCSVSNGGGTMMTANVANITVDCDLLAYFPFNGNANDASGYGNNGAVTNATLTTDVAGNANGAYLFSGNANITVAMPPGFLPHGSASRTMTAWIKPTKAQGEWGIVSYGTGNCTALQFGIGLQGSATFWGGCDDYQSGLTIPTNSWTFVAVVYSSATPSSLTMYTNGSANVATKTTMATLATPMTSNLVIGRDNANNANFTGDIDSVRIYGHALSAAEVQAVFAATP